MDVYLMWRQLTQHFFGREPQDEGQILDDSTARVQLPDTPGQQQTPLQSDIELQTDTQRMKPCEDYN